tara:strand:+ start:2831 stop:3361 length:531 start_codon:yes stop_codon:yes gene_type:complete
MPTNLQFITSANVTGATSLSITNCFTDEYDIYKVFLKNFDIGSGVDLALRFINASGSVVSDSNYSDAVRLLRSYSGGFADIKAQNIAELKSIGFYDPANGVGQNVGMATNMYVQNPFSASSYTFANWSNTGVSSIGTPARKGIGVLKQTVSMTGLHYFTTGGETILGLNISVYGVK